VHAARVLISTEELLVEKVLEELLEERLVEGKLEGYSVEIYGSYGDK